MTEESDPENVRGCAWNTGNLENYMTDRKGWWEEGLGVKKLLLHHNPCYKEYTHDTANQAPTLDAL